jgi:hypothetical protein
MILTPLYGHTDEATAYIVNDYPYSFKLRCRIRYWIEYRSSKGYRFCSQTSNPKKNDIWNAPKKGTYVPFAACLYLDEKNHVQWASVSNGSEAAEVLNFIESFPHTDRASIHVLVAVRLRISKAKSEGKAVWKIAGVPQMPSEGEVERAKEETVLWEKCLNALKPKLPVAKCNESGGSGCINAGACNAADKCILGDV